MIVSGTNNSDTLVGTIGDDSIQGLGGSDRLEGLAGNDTLDGGQGNDSLFGQDGDDILFSSEGNNTIDGGEGEDTLTVNYSNVSGSIVHDRNNSSGSIERDFGYYSYYYYYENYDSVEYRNIEKLVITGSSYSDTLSGTIGDTLDGGDGTDILNLDLSQVTEDIEINGREAVDLEFANTSFENFEEIGNVTTGSGRDRFIFDSNENYFNWDINLDGGDGEDLLSLDLSQVSGSIRQSNNGDTSRIYYQYYNYGSYYGNITYKNIENIVITGTNYSDIFNGTTGDTLDGGSGRDTLNLDLGTTSEDIEINSFGVIDLELEDSNFRNFKEVGSVVTGSGNDRLTFNEDSSIFYNDYYSYFETRDIDGGSGNDTLSLDFSIASGSILQRNTGNNRGYIGDYYSYSYYYYDYYSGVGYERTYGNSNYIYTNYRNIENITITGSNHDDIFEAGNGKDILVGGKGNDIINGGDGLDIVNGVNAQLSDAGKGEIDTLVGGAKADIFVIGNDARVFYEDSNNNSAGIEDYALIKDFSFDEGDVIRLHGERQNYLLTESPLDTIEGTAIYLKKVDNQPNELIAIVEGVNNLDLASNAFIFNDNSDNSNPTAAISLDGENDYVRLNNSAIVANSPNSTVEAWVKVDADGGGYVYSENDPGGVVYALQFQGNGQLSFNIFRGGVGWIGNIAASDLDYQPGEWIHVAAVLDENRGESLYVNGERVAFDSSKKLPSDRPIVLAEIGRFANNGGGGYFTGEIDEVRVWNVARSEAEIFHNYQRSLSGIESNLVGYWSFDEGKGLLSADLSTSDRDAVLVNDVAWVNNTPSLINEENIGELSFSQENYTVTEGGNLEVEISLNRTQDSNKEVAVLVDLLDGSAIAPDDFNSEPIRVVFAAGETTKTVSIPIKEDLSFEETETLELVLIDPINSVVIEDKNKATVSIIDNEINIGATVPEGENLITIDSSLLTATATTNPDAITYTVTDLPNFGNLSLKEDNYSLAFDGVDDYVNVGDSDNLKVSEALTIEAWIKPTGLGSSSPDGGIIVNKEGEYEIARFADGTIQWAIANSNPGWQWIDTGYIAPLNEWTHIALTYDGELVHTYANGVLIHSRNATGNITDVHPNDPELRIGDRQAFSQHFEGNIDNVRVWNIARNSEEIAANFDKDLIGQETGLIGNWKFDNQTKNIAIDSSENNNDGIIVGANYIDENPLDTPVALEVGDTFTQADLDNNRLIYESAFDVANRDSFKFTVDDGNVVSGEQTFEIVNTGLPVDLSNWEQQGALSNGNWQVTGDRNQFVEQFINGEPTFFVSPFDFINGTVTGTFQVTTSLDDDYIGFVFGYQNPISELNSATDDYELLLFDWKQNNQSGGLEGFSLSRLTNPENPIFWGQLPSDGFEVLATDYSNSNGWNDFQEYEFSLTYTEDKIVIKIDNETIFDVEGDFLPGRFGFYNFSQADVKYGNFRATGLVDVNPIANEDLYQTNEDESLTVTSELGLLANDISLNLGTFQVDKPELITETENGTIALEADGSFVYTPNGNFAGEDSFSYRLADGNNFSELATVTIEVDNVDNDAPTQIIVSNNNIDELTATDTAVATLSNEDPDPNDSHTYNLVDSAGDRFKLEGNELKIADGSLITPGEYAVTVEVIDAGGATLERTFNIVVNDVNFAPNNIVLSNNNIEENTANDTVVGELNTSDRDPEDIHSYRLINSAGGRFALEGNKLIVANGDRLDYETNQSHQITVRTTDNDGLFFDKNFTIDLTDLPNSGTIDFDRDSYLIDEDSTNASITLNRTQGTEGEIKVTVALSDGTASSNDYTNDPIEVVFGDKETTATVNITITDDSDFEPTETIDLTLTNPQNGAIIGEQNKAIASIIDNDAIPGILEFAAADYEVNEDESTITVEIQRLEGSNGDVSATILLSSDTATAGDDYLANPISVEFADGETSKTVEVAILDNSVLEEDETINLSLINLSNGATIGDKNLSVITIKDNDLKPTLTLDIEPVAVNEGDGTVSATISRNTLFAEALEVNLVSSDRSELTTPESIIIPAGEASVTVELAIVDDAEIDSNPNLNLLATAPGYLSASDRLRIINNDRVNLSLQLTKVNLTEGETTSVTVTRDVTSNQPLIVELNSDSPSLDLPQTITIPGNSNSTSFEIRAIDDSELTGERSATITAKPTTSDTNTALELGQTTATVNLIDDESPSLTVESDRAIIAENGTTTITISRNSNTDNPLTVNLTSSDPTQATVTETVTIPPGENSTTAIVRGVEDATNDGSQPVTITAAASGLNNGAVAIDVTDIEVADLQITNLQPDSPAYSDRQSNFTYKVQNLGLKTLNDTWTDRIYLSQDDILDNSDELLSEFEISANIQVEQFYDRTVSYFNPRTPGEYYLIATTDADNSVDEGTGNGESNNTLVTPFEVVPAFSAEVSTESEIGVAGEGIILRGQARSNKDNSPIPFEFVTIEVENNGFTRLLNGFTDGDGNFVKQFTPLSGEAGIYNIKAYFPDNPEEDTTYEDSFKILGANFTENSARHKIIADTPFSNTVSLTNATDTQLTDFTAKVQGAPSNWDIEVNVPEDLAGDGTNEIEYTITAPNESRITQDTFNINLTSSEGVSVDLPVSINLERIVPRLVASIDDSDISRIKSGMLRGEQTFVEIQLTNEGGATAENIDVLLPDAPWLSVASESTIESLDPGETTNVTLVLAPENDLDLTVYRGDIAFDAAGNDGDLSLPFEFRAVSEAVGSLSVNVVDELFYFTESAPKLEDATVVLRDYFTGEQIFRVTTDETGMVNFDELPEGYYNLEIRAKDHDSYQQTIQIEAGENETVNSFLSRQTVQYTWTVTETEIEDRYDIQVQSTFETDVPIPTVVIDPPSIDVGDLQVVGQVMQVDMTFTNHGLIAADNLGLNWSDHPFYKIEPLIENIDSLDAKSSITVPVRITRIADFDTIDPSSSELTTYNSSNVPCSISIGLDYDYECAGETIERLIPIPVGNVEGNCGIRVPVVNRILDYVYEPREGEGSDFGIRIPSIRLPKIELGGEEGCDPCKEKIKQQIVICTVSIAAQALINPNKIAIVTELISCATKLVTICNSSSSSLSTSSDSTHITTSSIDEDIIEEVEQLQSNLQPLIDTQNFLFGSTVWLETGIQDLEKFANWLDAFETAIGLENYDSSNLEDLFSSYNNLIEGESIKTQLISDEERNQLLSMDLPLGISGSDVERLIERWNRTSEYYQAGIFNLEDVPEGKSTDFIDLGTWKTLYSLNKESIEAAREAGFVDPIEQSTASLEEIEAALDNEGGICAKVAIAIDQEAIMTRSAFIGELSIENTSDTIALEDITVSLEIRDENGNIVNDLFGIEDPILDNLTAVDGSGRLGTDSTGSAEWSFIPTNLAAKEVPTEYSIGGSFSYLQEDNLVTVPLASTPITVYPQAELYVDYFQQRNVYGDDPFTEETEVAEPFSLGVLVDNRGFGAANNLSISSAEPKIIENEKGLLIDFDIIGSQVNGNEVSPSLTADFGTIEAGETAVADWLFKSSLQGKFVDYKATFEHINDLGNPELSLIKEVDIHELVQKVAGDGDGLPDFLVNDKFDANFYPDILYFSDGTTAPVTAIDEVNIDAPVTIFDLEAEIQFPLASEERGLGGEVGWRYITLDDPANGQFEIAKILRSDGVEVNLDNIWRTDRTFPASGRPIYENKLHFIDRDSTGSYTVIYDSNDDAPPEVREIVDINSNPRNLPVDEIKVVFNEPIRANSFDYRDLALTLDNNENLITEEVTVTQIDPITFEVGNLTNITGNIGQYKLSVDATGVKDLSGNDGGGTVTENWVFTGERPAIASVTGIDGTLLTAAIDTLDVTFTKDIDSDSFDYRDITLTRNDGGNLVNDTVAVTKISDRTYRISNLAAITDVEGDYELLIAANNIRDTDGNNGIGGKGLTWVLDATPPSLTAIDAINSPRNSSVNSLEVSFNQAIDGQSFTYEDLVLTLDGGDNLITEDVTIDKRNETTYTIKGLNNLQTDSGEYSLTVKGDGIEDNAGNLAENSLTSSWVIDKENPLLPTNLQVVANSNSNNYSYNSSEGQYRVNSQNITISGDVSEADLQIYLEDSLTGEPLGQAIAEDNRFTANIELSGVGSRGVELTVTDKAGNAVTTTLDLFVDVTQPAILEITNLPENNTLEPVNYLDLVFSEAIALSSLDYQDLTLTRNGGENLITDAITIESQGNSIYRIQGLNPLTQSPGNYQLTVKGTGVRDRAGNLGLRDETVSFAIAAPPNPEVILRQTQGNTTVVEGRQEDSYTLVLATQPTADVTVTLEIEEQISTNKTEVTFTPENWDTPQNIIITADNDTITEGSHSSKIVHTVTSEDNNYQDFSIPDLTVAIDDNDAEITGQTWNDLNGDGIKEDSEPKLANWQVYLDLNTNGILDPEEPTTTTDDDGNYRFGNLQSGTYHVSQVVREGWQQTYPAVAISTTASETELYTPSAIDLSPSGITTQAGELINLDRLYEDSRFADVRGQDFSAVVIDTGIDLDRSFFGEDKDNDGIADRIVYQYDFADKDSDAGDVDGHGSHVASIIASNDEVYPGIAPEANLIALKVFEDDSNGSFADLEASLQWVYENAETYNIAAVNLSLGDEQNWANDNPRYGIDDELAALASIGVVVTAATGNNYDGIPGVAYPAADPNAIAVGAVESQSDRIAEFSQRHGNLTDIFAPGVPIIGANADGGTMSLGGTSQAAPHIAGIAVLAQQIAVENLGRKLTVAEFDSLLTTTGVIINDGDDEIDDVANTGLDYPRVDALALAEAILTLDSDTEIPDSQTPNSDNTNAPLFIPEDSLTDSHTVTLTPGDIVEDLDFGNQLIPNGDPVLAINQSLQLDEAATATITLNELKVTDEDNTNNEIVYTLIDNTQSGELLLNDVILQANDTFTQEDINSNALTYQHSGNETPEDSFSFIVSDGNQAIALSTFEIEINPVDDAPTVKNAIADLTVIEAAEDTIIDLNNIFIDVDNPNSGIVITVDNNSNEDLVDLAIADNNLILDYQDGKFGTTEIALLATSNGKTVTNIFTVTVTADSQPIITITDSSGNPDDKTVKFGTPLSESNSDLVRPNYPDDRNYIDITNSGDAPLNISEILINVEGVTADLTEGDILLNPNQSQRVNLTYTPTTGGENFNIEDGIIIFSDAVNDEEIYINLTGKSTFTGDITYDGKVNLEDLDLLSANLGIEAGDTNWDRAIDVNGDGLIGFGDLELINQQWNNNL